MTLLVSNYFYSQINTILLAVILTLCVGIQRQVSSLFFIPYPRSKASNVFEANQVGAAGQHLCDLVKNNPLHA